MSFTVNRLKSGGLLTTYNCSVECMHCRHKASPKHEKQFISEETLAKVLKKLEELHCNSIHIEGGEPFLFPNELIKAVKQINKGNILLEHIVTNCSWYKNKKDTTELLRALQKNGLRRLVLEVSPFQNIAIPLKKVQNVAKIAESLGINIIIWDIECYPEVAQFDTSKTHTLKKYIKKYGEEYMSNLAQRFNLTFSGRTFNAFEKHLPKINTNEILRKSEGCRSEMMSPHHFHVDLNGNFTFPLTQGLSLNINDIGKPIDPKKYPFVNLLYNKGVHGLYKFAKQNHNFKEQDEYLSKCHLCYDIRSFLVKDVGVDSPDLQPKEFYTMQ